MVAVKYREMEDKLLTLDQAIERLETTEPLGVIPIDDDHGSSVKWKFDPSWAMTIDTTHGTQPVNAFVSVNGTEHQLTKDAVYTAASSFGLPATHAKQLPAHLMEQEMNYWFGAGLGKKSFNLLTTGDDQLASAFMKSTKRPFSNLGLLTTIQEGVKKRLGNSDIKVDYKFNHSLLHTDLRLILPGALDHTIDSDTSDDVWSAGIHLSNSLTGERQTSIEPYLFRWICTNGATSEYGSGGGVWNRRIQGQQTEDVMSWIGREVDAIFDNLPQKWSELQKLTEVSIESNAVEILREVFRDYKVPYTQQNEIISDMADTSGALTMYSLMQSITSLGNSPLMKPERVDQLLRIGGAIPTALFDPLNRKLWDEGHTADPSAKNPYAV